jgi:nucleoside-diphosphate-sugar epimerase
MIIGSGLLAKAFHTAYSHSEDVCIYAAGVSNSKCTDNREFEREQVRLLHAMQKAMPVGTFVYFGTCSVADIETNSTPYVQHKLAMEQLVAQHPQHLILRLPQVAGITPNPHTLLNFLYAKIARSEAFDLWHYAKRNIIDVADVASIVDQLLSDEALRNITLNVANPTNYSMLKIVDIMESVIGKKAVYDVLNRGGEYLVDISLILPYLSKAQVNFGEDYLVKVINKYYGKIF